MNEQMARAGGSRGTAADPPDLADLPAARDGGASGRDGPAAGPAAPTDRAGADARPAVRRSPLQRVIADRRVALVVVLAVVLGLGAFAFLRPAADIPSFPHVYVIVMENQATDAIDRPAAPFLNQLAARYGAAINYRAIAHPSQPNYIALFSGSTHDVIGDTPVSLSGQNLADQLDAHGKSWRVFAENVPSGCYTGDSASGGRDGPGTYVRRHEPAIEFKDISSAPARCAHITDFSHFDPAAADFELIIPNTCHDMHDCSVQAGDAFLSTFVPRITGSPAWKAGSVLFITFDESSDFGSAGGGGVPTLVISASVKPGFRSSVPHDHYSLLRTVQDAWGLGCLAQSCSANTLREFFH